MSRNFVKANGHKAVCATTPINHGPYTMAAWVKRASMQTMTAVALNTDAPAGEVYGLIGVLAGGTAWGEFGTTSRNGTSQIAVGTWTHIAVTVTSGTLATLYVRGVNESAGAVDLPLGEGYTHLTVGCLDLGLNGIISNFDGELDEVAYWNVALSQSEITALQTALPTTVQPTALVAYYDMDDTSPSLETDKKGTFNLTLGGTTGSPEVGSSDAPVDPGVAAGVAPANTTPPHITTDGTPQTGESVTCSDGTWTGTPAPALTKQWKRGAANIAGAVSTNYTLQVADEGQTLKCTVTATNASGSASEDSDNTITPTAPPPGAPANTAAPTITPSTGVKTGDSLTVNKGTWTGSPTGYGFQLQRNTGTGFANVGSSISDVDGTITYVPVTADEDHPIRFVVTATNGAGSQSANSNSVTPVAPPAPAPGTAILRVPINGVWTVVSSSPSSSGAALRVVNEASLRPEDFTAYGTIGAGDDSVIIEGAIFEAAKAAMDNGSFYTEIRFDPTRVYNLTRNPVAGGTVAGIRRLGYSQIGIPELIPESKNKLVLKLLGGGMASNMHWAQTTSMKHGTVLKSTQRTATTASDPTHLEPNIFGTGPVQVGTNPLAPWFTNIALLVEGITFMGPVNLGMIACDGRGLAQMSVRDSQYMVDTYPGWPPGIPGTLNGNQFPTDPNGVGFYFPIPGNNAVLDTESVSAQGVTTAFVVAEHFNFQRLTALHCRDALRVVQAYSAREATAHGLSGSRMCVEACYVMLRAVGNTAQRFEINIQMIDTEIFGGVDNNIEDPGNLLHGYVGVTNYSPAAPNQWTVNGAKNLKIDDLSFPRGSFTMAAAGAGVEFYNERPASGAAGRVIYKDRKIYVAAGTLTGVTVDGVSLGARTEFEVPSGLPWTITYSSAPTLVQVIG